MQNIQDPDRTVKISYTDEELETIYQELKEINAENETQENGNGAAIGSEDGNLEESDFKESGFGTLTEFHKEFDTDQHLYLQRYSIRQLENNKFYTVTNQRLGIIDLTVTKDWRDGEGDTREEFLNLLEEQGASLGVRLVCTDNEDAINYKDNTVDIGDGAYQIMKPAEQQDGEDSDDQTETLEKASAIQKIDTDTAKESTNYYFYNLPKYTQYGQAVHYTVEEVVIYEDDTVETFADFKKKNPKIIYNATMESTPYVTGEQHTHDTQTFQLHNSISGTKDVTFHKHWQDDYRNQLGERPDLSLDLYQRLHDNKDDRTEVVLKSYYKDYEWSRNENAGDDEVWDITLKGLPKYDRWGYEIDYYAKENVNISRETFDYLMPAYLYPADGTTYVEVGSETEGPKDSYKDEDYVIPLDNTNSTWLLKENGTFVNKIQEDVIFNGVKLWRLIPSGFPDAQLPEVTFSLYRKDLSGSGTDEKVAWVTIQNWEKDSSGSYRFALEYEGENKNKITDGKLEVTCGGDEKDAKRLQQYDENGRLYSYYIKEEIKLTKEDGSTVTAEEIYNSEISGSTITNGYNSEKGNLTVKKIVELGRDFAKGEKYPEVSFTLTRYYKDNAGKLCRDTSYSVTQTITAAMLEDGDGTAWATFPNLLIYAPNGTKYQYAINENMDKLKGGYEVFAGRGDLSEDQVTASYTPPADLENPNEDLLLEASKDDTETPDITYKNTRKADTVKLEGKKVWNDRDDDAGLRPDIDKNAITLEVSREAAAQGSGNAIPKQKLAEDEYEVVWEQDPDNKNNWTYTITGKDDTELEQYSPNGNPWKYTVKEILSEPWSSYYRYEKQEVVQSGTVTDSTIQMPDLKNSLLTSSIGYKKWVPKDSTDGLKSDYLGYKMKVTFQLQARVDGVVADGTLDKDQKSNWFAADKLLEKITSDKDLIPDPIQKTIGPNFILPNASNWGNAAFSNLLTAVKAEQEAADLGITQDSIVKIKYRVVETQAEYYKNSGGQDTLIYTQKYGVDMAKDTPEYTLEGAIGLFDQVTVTGSWVRNVLPTVKLEIWKIWKNDSHNAFNTRPQENGNSVVKFVVQRREKGSTDDNAWEIVKSYDKEGKATDLVRTLQLGNSTDSGRVIVEALPQYDFVIGADNTARKVEYEYRARELQAGADTSNGVKEQDILQDNDTFNTAYGSVVTDGAEAIKTETGKVVNSDSDYATAVTNTMKETEVYAEKEWKTDEIQVSASYPDVTLMLQYLKDDGSAQGTWTDFSPKAKVVLNGEQDTDTTKPYYEYEAWKALWKAPEVMPGSKLKDNKTQYRVVEVTDNTYPEEVESGTGTENDPYVFLFGTADGTKDSPYTITNDRTKLKIAKSAETGGLDEEFIFTIKPKDQRSRVKAYYVKYDAGGTAIQDGTGEGTLDMSSGGAASFTLKDGQYAVIYNLVREGQYLVTESGVKGEETSPDALKNYEITGENQDNLLTMTSSGKGQFSITTPETKPDQIPELTVTNRLQGKITIQKTDEKGKALSGVTFQLKWREKGSPEGTEYQVLDDTVCSNADLVTGVLVNGQEVPGTVTTDANGEAVFDGLYLGANGREYQITELAAKDGYNVLSEPVEGIEIPYETAIRTVNSEPWRRVKGKYYYLELTLTVENNKVFHMPNTSGTGFFWPGMGALAVAVAASGFYIWQKEGKYRKKRRKS